MDISQIENGSATPTLAQLDEAPWPLFSRIETITKSTVLLLIVAMSVCALADYPVCHFVLAMDEDTCQSWNKYMSRLRDHSFTLFAFVQVVFAIYARYWAPEGSQSHHGHNGWDGPVWTGSLRQSFKLLCLLLAIFVVLVAS